MKSVGDRVNEVKKKICWGKKKKFQATRDYENTSKLVEIQESLVGFPAVK